MREKKDINIEIGSNIKYAREQMGITQEQLAEMLDIGDKHLSSIERGACGMSLTTLRKICVELSVSADFLLFGKESETDIAPMTEHLSPAQRKIVRDMVQVLLKAFEAQ